MTRPALEVADILRGHGPAWRAANREAELLPVPYFHVVYTLPSKLRDIAYQNKRVVYDPLMKAAAETTLEIATDPKRLGARIGVTAVLHMWGSALTHHPHVHMIVPGGGLSLDDARWGRLALQLPRACQRAGTPVPGQDAEMTSCSLLTALVSIKREREVSTSTAG